MEFDYTKDKIVIRDKAISTLDKFALDFTRSLSKYANYVIVSGYVAILFGRNRNSEDIDVFVERIDFDRFRRFWIEISKNFECINTRDVKTAYEEYISSAISLRFSKKKTFIPNVELKFPKIEIDYWSLRERKKVLLNDHQLFIAPLELQIPFKLYLGSEKDIEDAKHIYGIFKDKLNLVLLNDFNRKFKTLDLFNRYLK
jgi:hypothetical protein